ncbi:MAG: ribose 5-phosphate isomerase B [Flavobacteriales bacterium]
MKIVIGSDHAGFELKTALAEYIKELGHELTDHGTYTLDSVDYPDFAHKVASDVNDNTAVTGVLVCGSGQGVCMTANKYSQVRAALVWNLDIAELSREHNNANVICLPARFVNVEDAKSFLKIFLKTEFEGGRHERRVNKIAEGIC